MTFFEDRKKYLKLLGIAGVIVIVDQAAKALITHAVPVHQSVTVIPNFFNLTHIHNPGGAFGFLASHNSALRDLFFLVASIVAVGLIGYLYASTPGNQTLLTTAFCLILGGAVGNLIDRVRLGKVIDFLDFHIGNLHWPAFNVADSAISAGIALFLFHVLFKSREEPPKGGK